MRERTACCGLMLGLLGAGCAMDPSEPPEGTRGAAALTESAEARARVASIRERFALRAAEGPAPGTPGSAPNVVVGPGVATSFEPCGDASVRVALPRDDKRRVTRSA